MSESRSEAVLRATPPELVLEYSEADGTTAAEVRVVNASSRRQRVRVEPPLTGHFAFHHDVRRRELAPGLALRVRVTLLLPPRSGAEVADELRVSRAGGRGVVVPVRARPKLAHEHLHARVDQRNIMPFAVEGTDPHPDFVVERTESRLEPGETAGARFRSPLQLNQTLDPGGDRARFVADNAIREAPPVIAAVRGGSGKASSGPALADQHEEEASSREKQRRLFLQAARRFRDVNLQASRARVGSRPGEDDFDELEVIDEHISRWEEFLRGVLRPGLAGTWWRCATEPRCETGRTLRAAGEQLEQVDVRTTAAAAAGDWLSRLQPLERFIGAARRVIVRGRMLRRLRRLRLDLGLDPPHPHPPPSSPRGVDGDHA